MADDPKTLKTNKRKGSDEDDSVSRSSSSSSSSLGAPKNKRQKDNFTLESLRPFDFLITAPPIVYVQIYPLLSDWMEGAVNGDFSLKSNPFVIPDIDKTSEYYHQIQGLLHAVNEPKKINENFEKFSIVDKILCLSPSETWDEKLEKYTKLQKEVWWVQTANKRFRSRCFTYHEYLKTGTAAVVLELWYRFVWAKYTYGIHERIRLKDLSKLIPSEGTVGSTTITNGTEPEDEEIIDLNDLGAGAEEEVEDDDEDSDDGEHDVRELDEEDIANSSGEESEAESEREETVPGVVSLFFTHINITNSIDEIEALYFDKHPTWDISKALAAFVQLVALRNRDHKVLNAPTMEEICDDMHQFYLKKMVPFLACLGVIATGSEKYQWTWTEENQTNTKTETMKRFVDQMYVNTFRNLTDDGSISHSHEFFELFPDISQMSDPRSVAVIPHVYTNIQSTLKTRGLYLPEVDTVVTTLDDALSERDNLIKTIPDDSEHPTKPANPLIAQVAAMKRARLSELDALIEKLRDEYHKLTASVDQIQSTPIAKPVSVIQNYEPPLEVLSSALFQLSDIGEWIFVSLLMDRVSIRRIAGLQKVELSGEVEKTNHLDSLEGCNQVLKIFATDSKFKGNALFLFRANQLFGPEANKLNEEYRWVFDLLLDHPTRTRVAVVDWHNSVTTEELENHSLPLTLDSIKLAYNPYSIPTKPSIHPTHPFVSYLDFKWIFAQMANIPLTTPATVPSSAKLCLFIPQNSTRPARKISAHSIQLTNSQTPPKSSIFFLQGGKVSLLVYWEPSNYVDNTNLKAAFQKYLVHSDPSAQLLVSLLTGTDKKGSKKLKARLIELQIWKHAACIVVFDTTQQFTCISSPSSKDFVRLYGVTNSQPSSKQIETEPKQAESQPIESLSQKEQPEQTPTEPKEQTKTQADQIPQDNKITLPLEEFHGLQLQSLLPTKQDIIFDENLHRVEYILSPHQHFLYLTLGNQLFWETAQNLHLPSPSYQNLPNPLFQTIPILHRNAIGPIPLQEYKKRMDRNGNMWMDENCQKILRNIVQSEFGNNSLDMAVIMDGNMIDQCNLESSLDHMSI